MLSLRSASMTLRFPAKAAAAKSLPPLLQALTKATPGARLLSTNHSINGPTVTGTNPNTTPPTPDATMLPALRRIALAAPAQKPLFSSFSTAALRSYSSNSSSPADGSSSSSRRQALLSAAHLAPAVNSTAHLGPKGAPSSPAARDAPN